MNLRLWWGKIRSLSLLEVCATRGGAKALAEKIILVWEGMCNRLNFTLTTADTTSGHHHHSLNGYPSGRTTATRQRQDSDSDQFSLESCWWLRRQKTQKTTRRGQHGEQSSIAPLQGRILTPYSLSTSTLSAGRSSTASAWITMRGCTFSPPRGHPPSNPSPAASAPPVRATRSRPMLRSSTVFARNCTQRSVTRRRSR